MEKILIIVDMQNDFISGSLGTPEAEKIVNKAVEIIQAHEGPILLTLDTHGMDYLQTAEGRALPVPHCVKGTHGHSLHPQIAALKKIEGAKMFEKTTFGSTALAAYLKEYAATHPVEEIAFLGICTDICVVSNALLVKAALPEIAIVVHSSACAGVTPAKHTAALETMGSCQIAIL